jgi:tetratricopeptide (TPR) repeat protein
LAFGSAIAKWSRHFFMSKMQKASTAGFHRFRRCVALKGRENMPVHGLLRPFRASSLFHSRTQGVALGFIVAAFQAEERMAGYANFYSRGLLFDGMHTMRGSDAIARCFTRCQAMTGKSRKQHIEEMLGEDPNDPELRYALAMEYVSAGDDQGAVQCFRELTTALPEYVPAYFHMAQALIRSSHPDEARLVIEGGIAAARKKGDHHAADELQGLMYGLE